MKGLIVLCALCAFPAWARAQTSDWYAGAGAGPFHIKFQPDYTTLSTGERQQFINEADGTQVDLLLGRRHRLNDRVSLGFQGTVSLNGTAWTLSLPSEPAEFEYKLPRAVTASFVPELRLGGPISAFAEIGGGAGFVQEDKFGSTLSTYRVEQWRPVGTFGGGARVKIASRASIFAAYRVTRYSGFEFDTLNAAGARVEHVKEAPCSRGWSFGLTISF